MAAEGSNLPAIFSCFLLDGTEWARDRYHHAGEREAALEKTLTESQASEAAGLLYLWVTEYWIPPPVKRNGLAAAGTRW